MMTSTDITTRLAKKKCAACKDIKALTEFYASKTSKDGRLRICKECSKEKSRKTYMRKKRQSAKKAPIEPVVQAFNAEAPAAKIFDKYEVTPDNPVEIPVEVEMPSNDTNKCNTECEKLQSLLEIEREKVEILMRINTDQAKLLDLYREQQSIET